MADNQPEAAEVNTLTKHTATLSLQNSSPLLDLAAEIRLKILGYALPPVEQQYHVCENPGPINHTTPKMDINSVHHLSKHCPGILLVNHQIYNESLEFVRGVKEFSFCCLPCTRRFLQNSNKEHVRQISKLSCQHSTMFHIAGQPGRAYLQSTSSCQSHEQDQDCLFYFVDSARSAVSQHTMGASWKQSLAFEAVQHPMILRVKWTLSLSKESESVVEQHHKNDDVPCFVVAAGDKDIAEAPVTDLQTMRLVVENVNVLLSLKAQLGPLIPVVRSMTPPWIQGYVVS